MDDIDTQIDELAESLEKAAKQGEGSRGGKIIGHTRSGKPIYDEVGHSAHASFSPEEHGDASSTHSQISDKHWDAKSRSNYASVSGIQSLGGNKKKFEQAKKQYDSDSDSHKQHRESSAYHRRMADYKSGAQIGDLTPEDHKEQANRHKERADRLRNPIPKIGAAAKPFPSKEGMKDMKSHEHKRAAEDHDYSAHHAIEAGDHETAAKHMAMNRAHSAYAGNMSSDAQKEEAHTHAENGGQEHVKKQAKMLVAETKHGRGSKEHQESELDFHDHVGSLGDGPASKMSRTMAENIRAKQKEDSKKKPETTVKNPFENFGEESAGMHDGAGPKELRRIKEKKPMKKSFEAILDTVMTIGPEALRKAIPTLSEDQKKLLQEVLSKAKPVSMDEEQPEGGIEENQEASEKVTSTRHIKKDDKMVKKEAAKIQHQGDSTEQEGQIIKSEDEESKKQLVERMKAKGLKKSDCIQAAQEKKMDLVVKAIEAHWGEDTIEKAKKSIPEEMEEAEESDAKNPKKDKKVLKKDATSAIQAGINAATGGSAQSAPPPNASVASSLAGAFGKSEEKECPKDEKAKEESEESDEEKTAKKNKKEDKKMGKPLEKSFNWKERNLLEVSTRRGQNAHYTVEDALLKAEQEKADILAKGGYLNETAVEPLEKSKDGKTKVTANDIIEKGLDMSPSQIDRIQRLQKAEPNGAFTVKSFNETDLLKSLGISSEDAESILDNGKKKV